MEEKSTIEEPTAENGAGCDCGCDCNDSTCNCDCDCSDSTCDCPCCAKAKRQPARTNSPDSVVHFRMNDTVGSIFLGILTIMLLIFLVRSNKRNRELLLEVFELRKQP